MCYIKNNVLYRITLLFFLNHAFVTGLILVNEPYFNEAGYEKQKGSQQGKENSRMYNEMAVLKLIQSMSKLIINPPPVFKEEVAQHFTQNANK